MTKRRKTVCGARLEQKDCPACLARGNRSRGIYGIHEACPKCGEAYPFYCQRPVFPGERCEFHVGRPHADEVAKTLEHVDMMAFTGEAKEVYLETTRGLDKIKTLKEQLAWLRAKAAEQQKNNSPEEVQMKTRHMIVQCSAQLAEVEKIIHDMNVTPASEKQDVADVENLSTEELTLLKKMYERGLIKKG